MGRGRVIQDQDDYDNDGKSAYKKKVCSVFPYVDL